MADTYDLNLVAWERYKRGFRYKVDSVAQNLTTYSWAAQARQAESKDADLILDLTPYLTRDGTDPTLLNLDIPANITGGLDRAGSKANWDLHLWPTASPAAGFVLVQGRVTIDRTATARS